MSRFQFVADHSYEVNRLCQLVEVTMRGAVPEFLAASMTLVA